VRTRPSPTLNRSGIDQLRRAGNQTQPSWRADRCLESGAGMPIAWRLGLILRSARNLRVAAPSAIPGKTTRSPDPPSFRCAAGFRLRVGRRGADRPPSKARDGRGSKQQSRRWLRSAPSPAAKMCSYTGTIKALSLNIISKGASSPPNPRRTRRRRICARWRAIVAIGVAWKRASKEDTSFPAPIYANLVEVEAGYALVWSR
jgi:uncharacterized protein (DUF736 family)